MFLLIMACVRWPAVVYQAMGALDGFEPRSGSPAGWHLYLVRLLRLADGHEWREMFTEISQGRGACYFGLLWLCKTLGVVRGCPAASSHGCVVVKLGVSQKAYAVQESWQSYQRLKELFEAVQASGGFAFLLFWLRAKMSSCSVIVSWRS